MAGKAGRKAQRIGGAPGDAGEQPVAAAAQLHDDARPVAPAQRDDLDGQLVQRRDALLRRQRQHDVVGVDAHAHPCSLPRRDARQQQPAAGDRQLAQPVGVMGGDAGTDDRAGIADAQRRHGLRVAQNLGRRARAHHPSLIDRDHRGGKPRDLGDRMADIKDRHLRLAAEPFQVGQDLGLAGLVQRGERLVHQKQARAAEQSPADGDALTLAARQGARPAGQQRADAQHLDHALHVGNIGPVAAGEPASVAEVLAHGHMREEPRLLEDVADAPPVRRQKNTLARIEQRIAIDPGMTGIDRDQAGQRVDHRGLARAGAAEQGGDAGRRLEGDVERKAGKGMADGDGQAHAPRILRATSRLTHSDSSSAAIATTTETMTSRAAEASPPGTCRKA